MPSKRSPIADAVRPDIEPAVTQMHMPAGTLGPEPATFDVRCFIVPHDEGIVLVDSGPPGNGEVIEAALVRVGAKWSDISDVVLTHAHFDHTGSLSEVAARAGGASLWAGASDAPDIRVEDGRTVEPLVEGDEVRGLQVIQTPGHTPGHISLLHQNGSVLLIGDLVGSVEGALSFGPPAFTNDPVLSRQSLVRVLELGTERVLFSHGAEVSDPQSAIRDFLRNPA